MMAVAFLSIVSEIGEVATIARDCVIGETPNISQVAEERVDILTKRPIHARLLVGAGTQANHDVRDELEKQGTVTALVMVCFP